MDPEEESLLYLLARKKALTAAQSQAHTYAPESSATPAPAKAATTPSEAAPVVEGRIRVTCACGKNYRVGRGYAGRKTPCPACGESMTIPYA